MSIFREPAEETLDLYPGLVVCDNRKSGSITFGQSRLPIWCISYYASMAWNEFCADYADEDNTAYGFTEKDFAEFIHNLFEMRGEFARLLLVLANAERLESLQREEHFQVHAPNQAIVKMDLGDGDGVPFPPPWWEIEEIREAVRDQLLKCIDSLS